jgi:predicted transcriptional regulator YdeE
VNAHAPSLISSPEPRRGQPRLVAGLATRTTNAAETSPETARIPAIWQRFMTEDWPSRLAQIGASGPSLAVYSGYESDHTGSYQLLVGREVRTSERVTSPLQHVAVPAGSYLVFQCAGPLPQAVIEGWKAVWAFFDRRGAPARAYTYDVEVYTDGVEIWVSIRESDSHIIAFGGR